MRPFARELVAERLERLQRLDAIAGPLQQAVNAAVPQGSAAKELLSGTWLGHPLHPPLTDVVVGSWTSAFLLDLLGDERREEAADLLLAAGILAALPTAAAGLSDWAELRGGVRRAGVLHALGNSTALTLNALSWLSRRSGDRGRGKLLSGLGFGVATLSAWLGGHLSFARGVGVDQTAFAEAPQEWTRALDASALEDGKPAAGRAGTLGVVVVRREGRLFALAERCSHRGCSLAQGELGDDGTITCSCHGSSYELDGGALLHGPATSPQPALEVRERDGTIEVRAPQS